MAANMVRYITVRSLSIMANWTVNGCIKQDDTRGILRGTLPPSDFTLRKFAIWNSVSNHDWVVHRKCDKSAGGSEGLHAQ